MMHIINIISSLSGHRFCFKKKSDAVAFVNKQVDTENNIDSLKDVTSENQISEPFLWQIVYLNT